MPTIACTRCQAVAPAYYITRGLCDDCKWNTWIPDGYTDREEYELVPEWDHLNATRRPPLGAEFLDRRHMTISQVLPMCVRKPKVGSYKGG